MPSTSTTPPNRVKPQTMSQQHSNGMVVTDHQHRQTHPDQERSHNRSRDRQRSNSRSRHHQHQLNNNHSQRHHSHRSPNHQTHPTPPLNTQQSPLKQNGFPNSKRENTGIGGRISNEVISAKELDTVSDKQNHNYWFATNNARFDSPESIPVIPLFTHATDNSIDFHKNATFYNNARNGTAQHYNGVNTINYPKSIPYHNPMAMAQAIKGRNDIGDYEREDLLTMGRIQELRERMGSDKVKMNEKALWKCLGAEFLGTALLMFLGVGCVLKFQDMEKSLSFTGIALCWGFTVATLAQALGGVSCDINPAVTLACVAAGKTPIVKALMYILMQCLGALAGTSLLKAVLPDTMQGDWAVTMLAEGITPIQGCIIEIISTFMLVFTVFSVSDENRHDVKGSVPLAIGICVAAIVMCSGPLTGASLNPARSLGPSILANHFDNHWVYWVGPIAGAVAAALIYTNIFRQLRPDEIEALEAEQQLRQREKEAKENGSAPGV